jgi:hypothetical protein
LPLFAVMNEPMQLEETTLLSSKVCSELGTIVKALLPSIKMKVHSPRGIPFEKEFHDLLLAQFQGYTVAAGSITGYWMRSSKKEECNEHREYQIAVVETNGLKTLIKTLSRLARSLGERDIYVSMNGKAFLVSASKERHKA